MLGVLDSGLGGLSVVRALRERLPHQDVVFLADQAHVPYGEREPEELGQLFGANVAWLNEAGVSAIVMGCNTSCAVGHTFGWPTSRAPILDLIDAAAAAAQRAGIRRIGVIATTATVKSGAYAQMLRARMEGVRVTEVAAPALVPLVEAGLTGTQQASAAVGAVCAKLPKDIDGVILGCTHYPFLDAHFSDALGDGVLRIDPASEQAARASAMLPPNGAIGFGRTRYVTNGPDPEAFRTAVRVLTGELEPACEPMAPRA
ncbi:MAG: glutamate racemase [Candidatus Eremiobacter antarcticus]|nr:MAG: glutamate racemase [Candidatus Eremiobacteraeota bacterium]PZR64340.1 MAG: glutamate racemase [Candidatus Eremiobacter sp. RRmetagenome_bin22]